MELFLDSADISEIRTAARWGILAGVTTNPTLLAKAGRRDTRDALIEIASIVGGPISMEVVSPDADGMIREAREFATWARNIVVKIPLTLEGLTAVSQCAAEGIRTNVTLCFSAPQGLMAARAGATMVSPFCGRLDDIAVDGMQVVRDLAEIFRLHEIPTKVLAASIRHPLHVIDAAKAGADYATIPFSVMAQMAQHPLTDAGVARFLADWDALHDEAAMAR